MCFLQSYFESIRGSPVPNVDLARHERIKCDLRICGSSLREISRELGVGATSVTTVCQGHRTSKRIEAAIARELGTCPSLLWPDRYPDQTGSQS
ncbi:helix-turn-helix domain-containing protein [Palleronia sp. LCG004]|uniref:helix-turn-helix domain-containing protein n=1 Tax=Palleronia sp. LCG004 TaxID=3079304 RepID=UPI00397E0493